MLKRIYLQNFKSWKELDITLGQVTGLFGTNSSGKSSIFQFMLLLKQTKNATDRSLVLDFGSSESLVNLGSFQDIIYGHDTSSILTWKLLWNMPYKITLNDATKKRTETLASGSSIITKSLARLQNKLVISDALEYRLDKHVFRIRPKKIASKEYVLEAETPETSNFRFVRNQARAWALPGPIKTHLFPDQAKTYFKNSDFLGQFEAEYESLMDSIYYLGPLREYPKREYPWSGASPADVGKRGERTVEALLSATLRGEKRNLGPKTHYKPFQEIIAYWLKKLGLIHEFKIEEIGSGANLYRAVAKRDAKSPTALLTDVGFGVSQILPALVLLYYVPEGSTVLMEQPEIHLHPSVQSGLADVIIQAAQTRKLQVIVESHSEHLLRRLQRRVADETCSSDLVKLYFCDSINGHSKLVDLELDIYGEVGNWPDNFFGDEMTEIAETRKAMLRRKIKEQKGAHE